MKKERREREGKNWRDREKKQRIILRILRRQMTRCKRVLYIHLCRAESPCGTRTGTGAQLLAE